MDRRFLICAAALMFVVGVSTVRAADLKIEIEADAQGMKFQIGETQGTAERVVFDEAKGTLTLEGNDATPVRLVTTSNGQRSEITATKIVYFLKTNAVRTQSLKSLQPLGPQ